jgi:hypothetical protein
MTNMKNPALLFFALIFLALTGNANAQTPNPADETENKAAHVSRQQIAFTIDSPLEVPGTSLPAGKYLLQREQSSGHPIIQIFKGDGTSLVNTLIGIPVEVETAFDDSMIAIYETQDGAPPALRALFFAGDPVGIEFVYPLERAKTLAKQSGELVITAQNATSPNPSAEPSPEQLQTMREDVVMVVTPDGQSVSMPQRAKPTKGEPDREQ